MKCRHIRLIPTLFALAVSGAWGAGEIDLVEGNVSIANAKGEMRLPTRGGRIEAGDTLITGRDGEIHVRTDDSGFLALRPNTQLKIETYRAKGNEDDNVALNLLRGAFRSITGWVGKTQPRKYAVHTPTATIGIRGTDHEPLVIVDGPEAGTYDKVNSGGTVINTPFGSIDVQPKQVGFVPKSGAQPPKVLTEVPAAYRPSRHERVIDNTREEVEKAADEKLRKQQSDNERKGGGKAEKAKLGDAQDIRLARHALDDMLHAYERGDSLALGNRLNPAMIGYQQMLDDMTREHEQCKQMRVNLVDTQIQAGPDVAVIQTGWEKRCTQIPSFSPRYLTGHSTFLMHRAGSGWTLAALTGNNPFMTTAAAAAPKIAISYPGWSCATMPVSAAGVQRPFALSVLDAGKTGQSSVTVRVQSAFGEDETITLPAAGPGGLFSTPTLLFQRFDTAVTANNGMVLLAHGSGCIAAARNIAVTYSYTDGGTSKNVSATTTIAP